MAASPNPTADNRSDTYSGTPPPFGHAVHKYFGFDPEYVNLNHGSYGSLPLPVSAACEAISRKIESNPDKFMRLELPDLLLTARTRVANLINADPDEVVFVPNASHGIHTVLWNFNWNKRDIIVGTTTTYRDVAKTIERQGDTPPYPAVSIFNLQYPTTQAAIVESFTAHIRTLKGSLKTWQERDGPRLKVVAVIDGIVANPGVLYPWRELVQICREEGVWSVVDAAHNLGQDQNIDVGKVQPDFFVSNCHKWLFAKRGAAILYAPKRNQHILKSPFPTPRFYVSPSDLPAASSVPNFLTSFQRNGTRDPAPYLSVTAALDFRAWLGGEAKIYEYCHSLALAGGQRLAEVLGTELLDKTGAQTLTMVDVALPLSDAVPASPAVDEYIKETLLLKWNVYAAHYKHNGRWWTRCSAQIWNEISDFEYLGKAFAAICLELERKFGTTA
ncbi:PLP-dependent transferase [Dentipellis sp. KUC8613]|nr:PLP-dependent transferase [Dentipellis sp. KUC8613]